MNALHAIAGADWIGICLISSIAFGLTYTIITGKGY
jgi:hypothetical protein